MQENFNLLTVQNALGYSFKDSELIKNAFVHSSCKEQGKTNAGLVFLGRRLLEFVLCDYLYSRLSFDDEAQLSYQLKSYTSSLQGESYLTEKNLDSFIVLSPSDLSKRKDMTVLSETFLAIIAAIFKDGGLPALKSFILPIIRARDGDDRYHRSRSDGHVIMNDTTREGNIHLRNAKVKRKSSSIGVSKADTIVEKKPDTKKAPNKKNDGMLSKLTAKSEKKKKESNKHFIEAEPKKEQDSESSKPLQRKFIRDALAPVRLPDELRNYKPKNAQKTVDKSKDTRADKPTVTKPVALTHKSERTDTAENDNYKSLLQEYVQKNLRTANVIIRYSTVSVEKDLWKSEITVQNRTISKENGASKKEAEKAAAQKAMALLQNNKTAEHKWFFSLNQADVDRVTAQPDYVSMLNQYFQKKHRSSAIPVAYEKRASGNRKEFLVAATYGGNELATGKAASIKEAKQIAAKAACKKLGI